jgi:hypothetical protein
MEYRCVIEFCFCQRRPTVSSFIKNFINIKSSTFASVGLCVDFCAHIVHGFLTGNGSRYDPEVNTVYITQTAMLYISMQNKINAFLHINHIYLFVYREERILFIMEFIAPAVMNGGFSTIVALSLLG